MTTFDPAQHILVVRDKDTGKHIHVSYQDVIDQIKSAPSPGVDVAPILERLALLEQRPSVESIAGAVSSAAASLAVLSDRLSKLEAEYRSHSHDYKLSEQQLQVIASAVMAELGKAGLKAA